MVDTLAPSDMFNILAFSTAVQNFQPNLVAANPANKSAAIAFVNQLTAMGLTNMRDAFKAAFQSAWDDTSVNGIVFLTDGMPTWPDTNSAAILDSVAVYNKKQVDIFTFGIGDQANSGFLKNLANNNSGIATMISADDSISSIMINFVHSRFHTRSLKISP